MLWVKIVVLLLLAGAVVALARALNSLVRGKGSGHTARALSWRVGLSAGAFAFLWVSMWFGWIEPHDVNPTLRQGQPIEQAGDP